MASYRFRILNVFAQTTLGGNPLAVFEDARGLDEATMQALARQFNLSETTFLFPSEVATARVRIFTPKFEMPFAGHPTLGTAHVVRELKNASDALTLEMQAGCIPVTANGDQWTLRANAPTSRPFAATDSDLAKALGLSAKDIAADAKTEIATAIANLDPTHEEACCHLMRVHAEQGDVAGALRIYKALWNLLDRDYGMEPSPVTEELVADIKLGAFERPANRLGA